MKFRYIDASEAPKPLKASTPSALETLHIIDELKPGVVVKIWPDENQSLRGLKTSFTRISRRQGVELRVWSEPGDDFVRVRRDM